MLCENGLIHAYAKQSRSVTPEIIEEIAKDFRLNVVRRSVGEESTQDHSEEVQRAARTLLDLYSYLREAQSDGNEFRRLTRTGKHEPII